MPAKTEKARRFFGAELGRAEKGQSTKTKMSIAQLKDFARKTKGRRKSKPKKSIAQQVSAQGPSSW